MSPNLPSLTLVAQQAMDLAEAHVRTHKPRLVIPKGDRDMTTDVDLAIERMIRKFLTKTTPTIGFLGEEEGRENTPTRWVLDPIDGTANFEFSGRSDIAFDAADQIEHISSRAVPDHTWHDLEANLGVDHHNRQRFHAAQRTCALRWLAVLWNSASDVPKNSPFNSTAYANSKTDHRHSLPADAGRKWRISQRCHRAWKRPR